MRGRMRSLKVLMFVVLAFVAMMLAEVSQAVAESFLGGDEDKMVSMVNQHRKTHGLRALPSNSALKWVARRQAQRMVMSGYIYHNPDLEADADPAIPGWLAVGENVGVGPDTVAVEDAFLRSPAHHANIHDREYNIIGLGAMASNDGSKYYTQNFALYRTRTTTTTTTTTRPRATTTVRSTPRPRSRPPVVVAGTRRPAARATQRPAAKPSPSPSPSPTPTPSPTPSVSETPAPAEFVEATTTGDLSVFQGIVSMLAHALSLVGSALSKLAFWR